MTGVSGQGQKWKNPRNETYSAWCHMIGRCTNPANNSYGDYGGRGIFVCQRWLQSYDAFVEDMGMKPKGLQLDRVDNEDGYYKGNCRWATRKEQCNNRRSSCLINYRGRTQTLQQWADELGFNITSLWKRMYERGWTIEKAFTTPMRITSLTSEKEDDPA